MRDAVQCGFDPLGRFGRKRDVFDPVAYGGCVGDETGESFLFRKDGGAVVFCTDDEGMEEKLKSLAEKQDLKKCILTLDNPAGPKAYKVAQDADVTVVLYNKRKVEVNRAFKKGELKEEDIKKIVDDLSKILP